MAGFRNKTHVLRRLRMIPVQARQVAEAQLEKNAEDLLKLQRRLAPVRTGSLRGTLRKEAASTAERVAVKVKVGDGGVPHAAWLEFGTSHMVARPYFFVAYRMLRKRFQSRLRRALRKAIREGSAT